MAAGRPRGATAGAAERRARRAAPPRGVRDAGGYPTGDGGVTRHGMVYRAAALREVSEPERLALRAMGLRVRIDLRSDFELAATEPDPLDALGVRAVHVPVITAQCPTLYASELCGAGSGTDTISPLAGIYVHLLTEGAHAFARAFEIVNGTTPALFHCATGRDRTGLLSALLLRVARVPDRLIGWDWSRSAPRLRTGAPPLRSPIEEALAVLDRTWGGAAGYLMAAGVKARTVEAFRRAFVDAGPPTSAGARPPLIELDDDSDPEPLAAS